MCLLTSETRVESAPEVSVDGGGGSVEEDGRAEQGASSGGRGGGEGRGGEGRGGEGRGGVS